MCVCVCMRARYTPCGNVRIMLAYSCRSAHTVYARVNSNTDERPCRRSRSPHTRIRGAHVRGRAAPRRGAEGSNFGPEDPDVGAFVARQPGRSFHSRVTTPSIHQFIIHLMTVHERARTGFSPPTRVHSSSRAIGLLF